MLRALATDNDHTRGWRAMPILIVAMTMSLLLAFAPAASAQDASPEAEATPSGSPDATPSADETVFGDVLISYDFDAMPQAPMTVRLLRITLAPGADVPMHSHPGIEFDYVESGTLTVRTDSTIVTEIDGEQSETSETQSLSEGSWVMFPEQTGMNLANESEEDVVLLSAVVLSVGSDVESTIIYTDGEPSDADFQGVSFVVMGDGLIQQFPDAPATITIDELTVEAGEEIPGFDGVAMLSKASGDLAFSADEGAVQVTRTATPQLQPNAIPGQEFELNDNDAAFFPAGYDAIARPNSEDALSFVRLLIQPEGELANDPAVVTTLGGEVAAEEEEAVAEGDGIGVGAVVALNTDEVNVRADASTASDIVDTFPSGTQFELTDGPIEGEDYTWYAVQGVGDLADVEGWLVTEFMDVIEPAPAGGAQTGDGSGGTDEEATDATDEEATEDEEAEVPETTGEDVTIGATVVLTEDTVRVREEPTAGAFIINTFDTGTELNVIGGPETNDGFTWYEVEVIDAGITGWTAVDFLEVVESGE